MNVSIISKGNVKEGALDDLANELPAIISAVLEVRGGNIAILKPQQVSLEFSRASSRDIGADLRIMVFSRINDPRASHENDLAKEILEKTVTLLNKSDEKYSIDVRLYLMEIGLANYSFP